MEIQERIIALLRENGARAVGLILDHYGAALNGIILTIVKDPGAAEEVLQETMIKVYRNGKKYDPSKGALFTWLARIARNAAIDYLRSTQIIRLREIPEGELSVFDSNSHSQQEPDIAHIGLRALVGRLEENYRTVIELVYFEGYSQQEVADELQLPLGTIKTRVRIGLRELRKYFSPLLMLAIFSGLPKFINFWMNTLKG